MDAVNGGLIYTITYGNGKTKTAWSLSGAKKFVKKHKDCKVNAHGLLTADDYDELHRAGAVAISDWVSKKRF